MKEKVLFLLFSLAIPFLFSCASQVEQEVKRVDYPQYEEVASKFLSTYSISEFDENIQLVFEKRPTGWHVVFKDISLEEEVIESFHYWDSKDEKYNKLKLDKVNHSSENDEKLRLLMDGYFKIHMYETCPYYGYCGWEDDVINDFGDVEELADTMMYGLARAYLEIANTLVVARNGCVDSNHSFNLKDSGYKMNDDQLKEYRDYKSKGIELLEELCKRNPGFNTIVGPIGIKTANEYMSSFYDILIFKNLEEAQKELKDNIYSDFFIALGKNYLNSCSENAILFTYGDNDTYPILYVQNKLNYRTDVLVVCLPFLATDWYINFIRDDVHLTESLPIEFDKSDYEGSVRDILYHVGVSESEETISIDSMLNYILSEKYEMDYYGEKICTYSCEKISFDVDLDKVVENGIVKLEDKNKIVSPLILDLDGSYLLKNHLIVLDMLRTNNWDRQVCFTSITSRNALGLDTHVENAGFVYKLVPFNTVDEQYIDTDYLYDFLMNKMVWFDLRTMKKYDLDIISRSLNIVKLRSTFCTLAVKLAKDGETEKAIEILEKCEEVMPYELFPLELLQIDCIDAYYALNDIHKADELLIIKLEDSVRKLVAYSSGSNEERTSNIYEIHVELETYRKILAKFQKYDRQELYDELLPKFEELLAEYEDVI